MGIIPHLAVGHSPIVFMSIDSWADFKLLGKISNMADSSSSQTAIDRLDKQTLSALLEASRAMARMRFSTRWAGQCRALAVIDLSPPARPLPPRSPLPRRSGGRPRHSDSAR